MKIFSCLNNAPYRPRRVLCVSKLSSLEFLRSRNPDLNEDQILSKLKERGGDPQEILAEHQRQTACEQNLAAVLKKLNANFRIARRIEDAWKFINWADLVVPIGGDGAFLLASKLITDNTKPVLGIDPSVSNGGNIFTLSAKYTMDTESIFERLYEGRALVRLAQRKMADALQPRQRTLPWLALNEVFIGEFMAARPITLHVGVENDAPYQIRSSGICVCTGTGSRFWYKSINVQSAETVRSIVEIATGDKLSLEETNELLHKYHQALLYSAEDLNMIYMIREIYHTTRCTKRKCCPDRQKCSKLTVKSCGFDAGLMIDGSISLPFNDGAIATFDIKPEYSLRSIVFT
ncbi:hypothetical protein K0M31_012962 [Melipona bicolor]|uniref:NAD(+) kinase n=1 Tax=Melipona bicolor TaxID=60889 RepID=A0AA40KGT6_9HYME|nr:hypothetical protein K0M31_012962 [Melipona bicolor]